MKILHLIRGLSEERALDTARAQRRAGHQVTLLLLHDAVLSRPDWEGPMVASADDVAARGGRSPCPKADYTDIVRLIEEHDRVISW